MVSVLSLSGCEAASVAQTLFECQPQATDVYAWKHPQFNEEVEVLIVFGGPRQWREMPETTLAEGIHRCQWEGNLAYAKRQPDLVHMKRELMVVE